MIDVYAKSIPSIASSRPKLFNMTYHPHKRIPDKEQVIAGYKVSAAEGVKSHTRAETEPTVSLT